MKKFLSLSFAVCTAATLLCGCGDEKKESQTANSAGTEKKFSFVVGFDAEFPPYGFLKDGQYKGFDLDLAREVCKRRNWKFVAKPINWDSKDMELNSGSISCIWNGFTINGRETKYTWSEPYVDNSQVILTKKSAKINKLSDLAGKIVAVQTDTPVQKALMPKGSCETLGKSLKKMIVTPNYNNAVMELEAGSVDAVAMDIGVANEKVRTNKEFVILSEVVISEKYGIGFKLGNEKLRNEVQSTLKEMVKDGSAAKISQEYFDGKNVLILKP